MEKEKEKSKIKNIFRRSKVLRSREQRMEEAEKGEIESGMERREEKGEEGNMKKWFMELETEFMESMRKVKEELKRIVK